MAVIGDKILWSEVLPGIDVTVRYIHDILKVDVKDNLVGYANNALSPPYSAIKKAVCGWITDRIPIGQSTNERWAVIWQFKEHKEIYYKPNNAVLSFTVSGDFATNYNHEIYKFDFDQSDPDYIFDQKSSNDFTVSYNNGITTVSVDIVTENPTFIRFIPNF